MTDYPFWIGFDLDGTLAKYPEVYDGRIGEPVESMVRIVRDVLESGMGAKIFTARASSNNPNRERNIEAVKRWLVEKCGLPPLEVTAEKDAWAVALYDDIAVNVERDKGVSVG